MLGGRCGALWGGDVGSHGGIWDGDVGPTTLLHNAHPHHVLCPIDIPYGAPQISPIGAAVPMCAPPPRAGPWLPLAAALRPATRPVPHPTSRVATATAGMLRGLWGLWGVSKGLERRGCRESWGTAGRLGGC